MFPIKPKIGKKVLKLSQNSTYLIIDLEILQNLKHFIFVLRYNFGHNFVCKSCFFDTAPTVYLQFRKLITEVRKVRNVFVTNAFF